MSKRTILLFLLLICAAVMAFAGVIRDGSLIGISNGSVIIVRWYSEDESGVNKVELERASGTDGQFILLNDIPLRGNNQAYEYIDDSAFRVTEALYRYRLKASFSNGNPPVYYGPITIRHDVNSVRRTWGSIKAMFR